MSIYDMDCELGCRLLKVERDKIKAALKLVMIGPVLHVDTLAECQQSVDDWLGKMMNVLEGKVSD